MGNRRDALKHSKAVSSSTESNSVKGKEEEKAPNGETDKPEGGITAWLASSEGVGWMQFFVVTNAIILLLTTGLPRIWESLDFLKSYSSSD
ncbi:hypothetical protein GHT06_019252 [Daphnia sinensis]|uniref:Uncharacterized protein n=1 Tax=Daphnia sinensis TaxID=1820382 RepID=A0AAD5PNC7_9CRUS|nr:hypothetical protein GHT06_019252 [Daphnia sinensis]